MKFGIQVQLNPPIKVRLKRDVVDPEPEVEPKNEVEVVVENENEVEVKN